MGTVLAKSQEGTDWIPVRWARTTAPETPFTLPALVGLHVTPDAMHVRPKCTAGPSDEEKPEVLFARSEILGVEIILMPDSPYADHLHNSVETLSHAVVRHRDAFGVVPFFESIFVSPRAYWIKALAKSLKDHLGIEAVVAVKSE